MPNTPNILLALLALVLSLPTTALAGGYFFSDSGIVALGRGGAFVAGADTQFAQQYNPAALVRIDAPTINIGWTGVKQNVDFDRLKPGAGDEEFYDTATNNAAPYSVPQLGYVMPIGKKFAFAFGIFTPYAPAANYDPQGEQRYGVIKVGLAEVSAGPSFAWRPIPQFAIGAGLFYKVMFVEEQLAITFANIDDPAGDIAVRANVSDWFAINANVGILVEPIEPLSIGLSVQPPTSYNARGSLALDFGGSALESAVDPVVYEDDDIGINLTLPTIVRAGIAYRPIPNLEIEAAFAFENWSILNEITVSDIDVTVAGSGIELLAPSDEERSVPNELGLPAGLRDTYSYRFGVEYRPISELEVRMGGFYETGAFPQETLNLSLIDTNKVQIGGGASGYLFDERLRIDASFAWIFMDKLEIRDSVVTQVSAGLDAYASAEPKVIGNGNISASGWLVGTQLSWAFRGKKK